jgi:predicted dehydrogenase
VESVKVGIIGCGVISNTYIMDMRRLYFNEIEIRAVSDLDIEKARASADKYQISRTYSIDEMLDDPKIELIINLTPPKAHFDLNMKILNAGKHLYCEKPFAMNVEEAVKIAELAKKKKLKVGCAPDTFMGSSIMTCRKLLADGWIGKPLYVNANMMNCGVETWHPSPEPFYQQGGGPIYDMGGYYFTTIVSMFGSVKSIYAVSSKGFSKRTKYIGKQIGKKFSVDIPTFYSFILKTKSGVIVTMNMSFDIWKSNLPLFEIYGTKGTLSVPDPNHHGGTPEIYRKEQTLGKCFGNGNLDDNQFYRIPELEQDVGEYVRGMGVADLATAIKNNTQNTANIDLAIHVLEIMTGVMESAKTGELYQMKTEYEKLAGEYLF